MLDKLNVGWYIADKMAKENEKMTDKPTGPAAAANEIIDAYNLEALTETIEAIILKHCPQDKAVEKLVEVLQLCVTEFERIDKKTCYSEREPEWWVAWSQVCRKLRAALAEYEANK